MYLAYLDDGGKGAVKVFGGIVVHELNFKPLEMSGVLAAIRLLTPDRERLDEFKEFHASDLFNGSPPFDGIDELTRHDALLELVTVPQRLNLPYIYSAVDMKALNRGPARSASWMDAAFNMCACAVEEFVSGQISLMILDEPSSEKEKGRIRDSFRQMRQLLAPSVRQTGPYSYAYPTNRLFSSVDDLFFGSSADSIGLQIADACNWVMWRYIDAGINDVFYHRLSQARIVCAKPEPEWTTYRQLFKAHDEP